MTPIDSVELIPHDRLVDEIHRPLLARQLQRVLATSGFYDEKLRALGLDAADLACGGSLERLPFTEKAELLAEQAQHPPFGRLMRDVPTSSVRRIHVTSGSTGRQLYVVLSEADVAATREAGRRAFRCAGLTPEDTVIHCLNYCLWAGGVTDHISLEATGATVIPFGVGNTRRLIETIKTVRPTAISCTPSYMSRLEMVVRNDFGMVPIDLGLRKGLFGGEGGLQRKAVRDQIERTWGIEAIDANYGMADVLSIFGAECPARNGLHFHGQGIVHLELIDPMTGAFLPIRDGQAGEMVLTNLTREAQPVLRYRTRDVVSVVGTSPCTCGRHSLRFRVEGRSDDMFTVRGVNVYPDALRNLVAEHPDWFGGEFEIVLASPPPIERPLVVVEAAEHGTVPPAGLEEALAQACRERMGFTPAVEVVPWGTLPRTEGKTRRVRRTYQEGT